MILENKIILAENFLNKADNAYSEAQILLDDAKFSGTSNRLYYSVLYATNAILCLKALSSQKHSGIKVILGKEFVKTGLIDKKYAEIFNEVKFAL